MLVAVVGGALLKRSEPADPGTVSIDQQAKELPNAGTAFVSSGNAVTVIKPDGTTTIVAVNTGSTDPVIAPAYTPNAGTVYLASHTGGVTAVKPDGTTTSLIGGTGWSAPAISPAGAPAAGTVYVSASGGNTVTAIKPDGTTATITVGQGPNTPAIAPAGTPNAGTVYVRNDGQSGDGNTVTAITPDGLTSTIAVGTSSHPATGRPNTPVISPRGTPNAGTVYVTNGADNTVTAIKPDGSRWRW